MAAPNLTEAVTTTLRKRNRKWSDNITSHTALLFRLQERGKIETWNEGRTLVEPLIYGMNGNKAWYDPYQTFDITPPEQLSAAEYDWKLQCSWAVIAGLEKIQNSGPAQVLSIVKGRVKATEADMRNTFSTAMYSDGTGSGGKEIGGLQLLIADDPTAAGTVGGIDQNASANAFWRNQVVDGSTTYSSSTIITGMNDLYLACIRGKDKPDLGLADATVYTFYEEYLQGFREIASAKMADAGFEAIKYKGMDIVYDDDCPANHMYFVNSDHLSLKLHSQRRFSVQKARQVTNGDYEVIPVLTAGNMCCSNRALQGVLIHTP